MASHHGDTCGWHHVRAGMQHAFLVSLLAANVCFSLTSCASRAQEAFMEERHEPQPGDASSLPHPERNVQVSNALQLLQPGAVDALTSPAACLRVLRQGVMGTLLERARGEGHAVQHRVACARALEQLVCLTSSVFGALRWLSTIPFHALTRLLLCCTFTLHQPRKPGVELGRLAMANVSTHCSPCHCAHRYRPAHGCRCFGRGCKPCCRCVWFG